MLVYPRAPCTRESRAEILHKLNKMELMEPHSSHMTKKFSHIHLHPQITNFIYNKLIKKDKRLFFDIDSREKM